MKNNNALRWFATSCFILLAVIILAFGMESSKKKESEENSYFSGSLSDEIDVFENLSFVDISYEAESGFSVDILSKNDDFSGNVSENGESGSVQDESLEQPSEISDDSSYLSVESDFSEESDISKEEYSKTDSSETSKEHSQTSFEESYEPISEELPSGGSEEPSEDVSKEPNVYPSDILTLEGGKEPFVFFQQDAPEWNNLPYGTDKIGSHGCGPVNMAMVISTLTGNVIYPDEAAKWSVDNGYWAKKVGTAHALMIDMAKAYGIEVKTIPQNSWTVAINALKEGKYIITRVKKGIFATNNHFLTIRGITEDGKLLIANSISYEDSVKEWDQSTIKGQINLGFWVYG